MKAFYVPGTHWDREWYEPFQEYRSWLVDLIDGAMDLLESDPEYVCFHLDGQAVVLEDYLDIRPEQRERLVRLLREKRLVAGPWYNLPDEWLVSGESFIRNLAKGMRVCRDLGFESSRFGYTPDQFGHVAALPMILKGMGMTAGCCWRGAHDANYPALFCWTGPDGSRMATFNIRDGGCYGSFNTYVRSLLDAAGEEVYEKHCAPHLSDERERSPVALTLLLDAIDHDRPDPRMPSVLAEMRKRFPDVEFVWAPIDAFGQAAADLLDDLPVRSGELRDPAFDCEPNRAMAWLIPHTTSARYPLKRRNAQCQALLEKCAEPLALAEALFGGAPVLRNLEKSWEYLLKNHPHDSICGCSVDQVHRDMMYRFDQSEMLADVATRRAMTHLAPPLAAGISVSDDPEAAARNCLAVHNPLPFRRREVVELAIPFARGWPEVHSEVHTSVEAVNRFRIETFDGRALPFQLSGVDRNQVVRFMRPDRRRDFRGGVDVYRVAVELDLPPCGFTTLRIAPTKRPSRVRPGLYQGGLEAENEFLSLRVKRDGTVSLTLKETGKTYDDLFLYESGGDSGDGWTYDKPASDLVFLSPGGRVETAVVEAGPLRTVFRIERLIELPDRIEGPSNRRSERRVALRVVDTISLEKGADFLRVHTEVENVCRDHRLRVLFPTRLRTDESFAESPFAVVRRPVAASDERLNWYERTSPENPFTSFCGAGDGAEGLALLAPFAPHEYALTETPDRSLALTLFRALGRTVGTSGEPDGQLQQTMPFDYLLQPFAGAFDVPKAARAVAAAQAGIRAFPCAEPAPDAAERWAFDVAGRACTTALKPAFDGEGGVVRFWNPADEAVEETLRVARPLARAWRCNLNEERESELPVETCDDGAALLRVDVPARGLATVRFAW